MKGFVPTPPAVVDRMLSKLFAGASLSQDSTVLDPGAGEGAFVDGLIRWFEARGQPLPRITAVESDPHHARTLRSRFAAHPQVSVCEADFLQVDLPRFDFVVGNPPYVSITGLSLTERELYRQHYVTARGRFDLYILFFERALGLLRPAGRLVFVTPEKYLYVETGRALRRMLSGFALQELDFIDEDTFPGLVTYPLITSVEADEPSSSLKVLGRDGQRTCVAWHPTDESWLGLLNDSPAADGLTLGDIARRVSCGVATGADEVFVVRNADLGAELRPFAHPTLAGRELTGLDLPAVSRSMVLPYSDDGSLLSLAEHPALRSFLERPEIRERLLARTCVRHKPWYAFHETPPLADILNPKILCKDIAAIPTFVPDFDGAVVPRHSLYYIVPDKATDLNGLLEYLRSSTARRWLEANSQRAAKGFLRMQSHVLKRLPVPSEFALDDGDISLSRRARLTA